MYFQYPKNYYFPPKIEQINYHSKDVYRPELLNCEFSLLSVLTRDGKNFDLQFICVRYALTLSS